MKAAITAAIPALLGLGALGGLGGCGSSTERGPSTPAGPGAPGAPAAAAAPGSGAAAMAGSGAAAATGSGAAAAAPGGPGSPGEPSGENVTARVQAMNAATYGRPTTQFRAGHVSPRAAPAAQRTATGFTVSFGSSAAVTTPTVYERAVIVSGGFSSKELYAFEATTGKSLWALDLDDDGPSSAACERGVCVVSTESCTLFAIAAETGKHLWSYWLGDPLTSAPTIANGRVFASYPAAGTADGKAPPPGATHVLAAFELATGKILWQLWLESDVMSAPVAVGEFVYATTFTGTVIKLEQATGVVRYAMQARATSAPVVQFEGGVEQIYYTRRGADEEERAGGAAEMVIRADHNHPKTKYQAAKKEAKYIDKDVQRRSAHAAKAAAEDSSNGFSGGAPAAAAAGYAFDNVGLASVSSMQSFQGSRIVKLKDRNVNTMGDEVIATDSETGKTLWTYKLTGNLQQQGGALGTAPLAAGGSILLGTLGGEVVRLDQKTGKRLATYAVGAPVRSQPVVANGWIYVGTDTGQLVAIDTKDPTVTGWSTWGGNAQRTGLAR
ncbi:MAG TPA: PQQ-binding-like beta-propeller repeat protein [Kofleriaceae bacterium]|nr:PQQ-binding-like beta-propeller repeat protein [Kofleriaceae bacterium]